MGYLALAAALVALALFVTAAVYAVRRGLALLREFRAFGEVAGESLAAVSASSALLEERAARVEQSTAALDPALARLAVSRAKLAVLLGEVGELRAAANRVAALRPRK